MRKFIYVGEFAISMIILLNNSIKRERMLLMRVYKYKLMKTRDVFEHNSAHFPNMLHLF